jgi:hypothetical protein
LINFYLILFLFVLYRLYLALIKSKQDELKTIQSLQQFPPVLEISNTNNLKQMSSLTPKGLIKTFQLEKSQLAFTMCNLSPNGETCIPDWNTTVYSTILTGKKTKYYLIF